MSTQLRLTNTISKRKEPFQPIEEGCAYVYVCGITPYDHTHIGHGRSYINFDVLVRGLKFFGYKTTYIRNFTDIDDKLLNKAQAAGDESKYLEIAEKFMADFGVQMERMGCQKPTFEPRATQCVPEMIELISTLLERGSAYKSGDDVYFDISKAKNYGKLSGKKIDELVSGARIDVDEKKRNPGDFVLWKGNSEDKFWQAPFGYGRPGWHIECSAMIAKHCPGRPLDIHGGGSDLIFPHHENEIAQSEAAFGYPLAGMWIHNAFVKVGAEKMSKSLGNTLSLHALFEKTDPMVFRFYVMQHLFSKPVDFCPESLEGARRPYARLCRVLGSAGKFDPLAELSVSELMTKVESFDQSQKELFEKLVQNFADDLNTSAVLGLIFKHLDEIAQWPDGPKQLLARFARCVLGLRLEQVAQEQELPEEVRALIEQRQEARRQKDFAKADQIRDRLKEMGYETMDKKL